jgi:hypothetical protein
LNFPRVEKPSRLWETQVIAKKLKIGDPVVLEGSLITYHIIEIDRDNETADITTTEGVVVVHHHVSWSEPTAADQKQNAVRSIDQATKRD